MQKISIKNSDFFSRKFCNGKSALNQSASRTVQGKAFTLIELLVVIAIVGILSGFIFVSMNSAITASKDVKRKADLSAIAKVISMYSAQNGGALPSTGTSCDICNGCAGACADLYTNISPYLASVPTDPNGDYYVYNSTGSCFTITAILSTYYTYGYDSCGGEFFSNAPITGACGSAAKTYLSYESGGYGADTFCSVGTASSTPGFPAQGASETWTCNGTGGSNTNTSCTAHRNPPLSATCSSGGGLTCTRNTDGLYTVDVVTYNSSPGSYTWIAETGVTSAEILIVGGGGSGGVGTYQQVSDSTGSAGGGGGVLHGTLSNLNGSYSVVIGPGGAPVTLNFNTDIGNQGSDSSFDGINYVAKGGGAGSAKGLGGQGRDGISGGSGSGAVGAEFIATKIGGLSTQTNAGPLTGYGNAGGNSNRQWLPAGSGGAGSAGHNNLFGAADGTNGTGIIFSMITGLPVTYASAGGAGPGSGGVGVNQGTSGAGNPGTIILRYPTP
jgi:prepilin-type N-terminal cleavage/methylation domain-containing protein